MKSIKQVFSLASLRQLMVIFFAGIVVMFGVACGASQAATPADSAASISPSTPTSSTAQTDSDYNSGATNKASTPGQNMYPYKDTKRDTTAADAKAERMIKQKQAEQQLQRTKGPGDYLEEAGKTLKKQSQNADESIKQAVEDIN